MLATGPRWRLCSRPTPVSHPAGTSWRIPPAAHARCPRPPAPSAQDSSSYAGNYATVSCRSCPRCRQDKTEEVRPCCHDTPPENVNIIHYLHNVFKTIDSHTMNRLTAWIISVSRGSGSGLMFRSSNSKRTAILVISISSSTRENTQVMSCEGIHEKAEVKHDSPRRRGWSTASERRLTTVSRPFTSADTAYIVVSLHGTLTTHSLRTRF